MERITTESKEIASANLLKVTVGSNCPQGGNSGHGGRTYLALEDQGSTDMRIIVDGRSLGNVEKIEIIMGGDCEHQTLIEALEFAVTVLQRSHGRSLQTVMIE